MTEELKRLFPEERYTLQSGDTVGVSPVPFGKLKVFGEAITSILSKLESAGVNPQGMKLDDIGRVFGLAFDEVISLMGLVLGKEREWFDTITIDDGIGLVQLIIRQNFHEDTKKKLADLFQRMQSQST